MRSPDGKLKTSTFPAQALAATKVQVVPVVRQASIRIGAITGIYIDANSVQHGFLRSPNGKFATFDAPDAGTGSGQGTGCPSDCSVSLNDWGAITGTYIDANFNYHGYLRTPKGTVATVDPPGSVFTSSSGINDSGAITGTYSDANGVYHGFVRILATGSRMSAD